MSTFLTDLGISIFLNGGGGGGWIVLFYPSNAFLYSELLTFFPCFRFIRHVSSCQPPTACICVHLANSREKYFFPSLSLFLSLL